LGSALLAGVVEAATDPRGGRLAVTSPSKDKWSPSEVAGGRAWPAATGPEAEGDGAGLCGIYVPFVLASVTTPSFDPIITIAPGQSC
jgi:hypothetical protein